MSALITFLSELSDLAGQLARRDYGPHTVANVLHQVRALLNA